MKFFRCFWAMAALSWLVPIAASRAANLQVLHNHVPAATARLEPVDQLADSKRLDLAMGLNLRNRAALTNLLHDIYDPHSPTYHHYLTPEEFAATFGPSKSDYDAVIAFANSQGLQVAHQHSNRLLLDVSGSVANIEKAFHLKLLVYRRPNEARTFYAPDREPSLDLAVPLSHIAGLDNYNVPHPANLKARPHDQNSGGPIPNGGSRPDGAFQGYDFRAAYLPGVTLTGSGQTLGLLECDGYYTNDIAIYESRGGLPSVALTNVLLDGFDGTSGTNNYEVALDIELAIAMAPGLSQVIVYEIGPNATADSGLNRMATDNLARQLSSSWLWPPGDDPAADQIFQEIAAQGQSFFNAAGDVDAYTNGEAIPFPADNPYLTVVGATALATSTNGWWSSETALNLGNGTGGSGGVSITCLIPAWQQGINMTTNGGSTTYRNLPDVAMAGNNFSVICNNGQTNTYDGTSGSTPLWAALMALANQQGANFGQPPAGFINPAIYRIGQQTNYRSCFHDITTGDNASQNSPTRFFATPGYDLCTGWGTPAGQALIDALEPPSYLVISPAAGLSASGAPGGPFTPSTQELLVSNHGPATLSWSLASPPMWLVASPTNGVLAAGSSATPVTVSFSSAANALTAGVYSATLCFTDLTTWLKLSCPFDLQVSSSVVQNGSFETGSFTDWSLSGNIYDNFVSSSEIPPHSGNYDAVFGEPGAPAYLSQTVPTSPGQAYLLNFWLADLLGSTPSQFLVNWIASPANTNTLLSLTNLNAFAWSNLQFVVFAMGTSAILQFGFQDDPAYLGLDDVSLVPVPTPVLQASALTGETLAFSWAAFPGLNYQLQWKTNLTQTGWINLGMPITASNGVGAATVPMETSRQGFYRLQGPQ